MLMVCLADLYSQGIPSFSVTALSPQSEGFYFSVPIKIGAGAASYPSTHLILDKEGSPVYYKKFTGNTGDFKIQPDGRMTYSSRGKFYIMDSTFTVKDSVVLKHGILFDGHDLQILSNGHFLLLGTENVVMDLSPYSLFNGSNPGSATATVQCGVIQEQDANKNVVFEWHCKDHYNFTDVDPLRLTNPNNVDWTHLNAVEQDLDGNFLLSVRHFNEITKIRRSDSSIVWRLGGNANQFNFLNDPSMFKGQHDVRRIGNGNLTLFDNGNSTPSIHPATAKEYQLNETTLTANLVWSYTENANAFSLGLGNTQRLPNGNTLIDYGMLNNTNSIFNVVTASGSKVFEIAFTDTLRSYRSFNYATLPWNLKRPVIGCNSSGGQLYLDAGSGYSSYLWSNGATTQTMAVVSTGTFLVWVPKGQGGFISSEKFTVNDLSSPCIVAGIRETGQYNNALISPNPFTDNLTIRWPGEHDVMIEITDITSRVIYSGSFHNRDHITIETGLFNPGIYFVKTNNEIKKLVKY